jgi:asparagine synthase (glutamine-hydrolysing)
MCGIIGIFSISNFDNKSRLNKALEGIIHRGPDAFGTWWNSDFTIGLGHRRLSILELSEMGSQPMILDDRYVVSFNGEIYNHVSLRRQLQSLGADFLSHSDTEVLLFAYKFWGVRCLDKLVGMFAFTIFDKISKTAFIARDRAGEKPLYFYPNSNEFVLSSELQPILKISNSSSINRDSLNAFLNIGFVPRGKTLVNNIFKLDAGSYITLNTLDLNYEVVKYWSVPQFDNSIFFSDDSLVNELDLLLNNAVELQGKADVNVGVLLSGGLDSSLVTSIASKHFNNVSTFTVSFPGTGRFDESEYAKSISNYFGTKHTVLDSKEITPEFFQSIALKFDDPIMDTSILPMYLISSLIAKHCKVAIGGDGADELFGGYGHYRDIVKQKELLKFLPMVARKQFSNLSKSVLPFGFKGRNWFSTAGNDFEKNFPYVATYYNQFDRQKLFNNKEYLINNDGFLDNKLLEDNLIYSATKLDFENYLLEDILVKVDRASMLNSLEIRAPFLDHRIIEFAFNKVPCRLKVDKGNRKIILKLLGDKLLPSNFNSARKQGFSIPIENWLNKKTWLDFIKGVLLDGNQTTFSHIYLEKLLKMPISQNKGEGILGLVLFEIWRNKNKLIVE